MSGYWRNVPLSSIPRENIDAIQKAAFTFPSVAYELYKAGCSQYHDYMTALYVNSSDRSEEDNVMEVECGGHKTWLHIKGYPVEYCRAYDHNPVY